MSQAIGPNYNGGFNPPVQGSSNGPPWSNANANIDPMMGNAYNQAPPMFGPMQGGGGSSFGTGSVSQDHLADLLNLGPIQNQVAQLGITSSDHGSPSEYYNAVLNPIMGGAAQAYRDAMSPKKQK